MTSYPTYMPPPDQPPSWMTNLSPEQAAWMDYLAQYGFINQQNQVAEQAALGVQQAGQQYAPQLAQLAQSGYGDILGAGGGVDLMPQAQQYASQMAGRPVNVDQFTQALMQLASQMEAAPDQYAREAQQAFARTRGEVIGASDEALSNFQSRAAQRLQRPVLQAQVARRQREQEIMNNPDLNEAQKQALLLESGFSEAQGISAMQGEFEAQDMQTETALRQARTGTLQELGSLEQATLAGVESSRAQAAQVAGQLRQAAQSGYLDAARVFQSAMSGAAGVLGGLAQAGASSAESRARIAEAANRFRAASLDSAFAMEQQGLTSWASLIMAKDSPVSLLASLLAINASNEYGVA